MSERSKAAVKAALADAIHKAVEAKRVKRGPKPERLKIVGFRNWEDAATAVVRKKKPPGGWPK